MHTYDAVIADIVPGERIVTSFEMHPDDKRMSVSLATMEFEPEGGGTLHTDTEQGALLDGYEKPEYRERGTADLLDVLGTAVGSQTTDA